MRLSFRFQLSCLLLLCAAGPAFAQHPDSTTEKSIVLMSRIRDGKVQLRWYPGSAATWRMGARFGYVVERMALDDENARFQPVREALFQPLPRGEWNTPELSGEFPQAVRDALFQPAPAAQGKVTFDKRMEMQNEEDGVFYAFILGARMSAAGAAAAGLSYEDADVVPGKSYAYRIYCKSGEGRKADTVRTFVSVTAGSSPMPAVTGVALEEGDGVITIRWDYAANNRRFAAYQLERSSDGGRTFAPLNRLPLIYSVRGATTVSYTDSVVNYRPYQYRVAGITPFSDRGAPGEALAGMGRDRTPPAPPTGTQAAGDLSSVTVTWNLTYSSPDLQGFIVARSTGSDGPFRILQETPIDRTARSFADRSPNSMEPYYIVYAVDTAGNYSNAFSTLAQISDSVAPETPQALTGTLDSNGHVVLKWAANTESDLAGYNIYVANAKDNVYRQLNGAPFPGTQFLDTVNMKDMNRSIWYKITAVDENNNPSPYTTALELKRPDVIPPAAPVFSSYRVEDGRVFLAWEAGPSDDVTATTLVRYCAEDGQETILPVTAAAYTDDAVVVGRNYRYILRAADAAGHVASSEPLQVRVYDNGVRPGVSGLKADWKAEDAVAQLSWRYDAPTGGHHYVIYRGVAENALVPYRNVKAETNVANDADAPSGEAWYAVKVLYSDGGESALSPAVRLAAR